MRSRLSSAAISTGLLGDREFRSTLLRLALPIATQQLVMNALNAIDVLMIGQLGDTAVAAVGLSNQVFFLMALFLFGVGSGCAIFSAQFWGRGDIANYRRVLGLALLVGVSGAAVFSATAVFAPGWVLSLYTDDPAVIAAGIPYLGTVGIAYVPTAISQIYGMALRSSRHVKAPMAVSVGAFTLKSVLAYVLIFGALGAPQMGIVGGATATAAARILECVGMLSVVYIRRLPAAAGLREMFSFNRALVTQVLHTASPVIIGEVVWSLGITTYSAIYARIGTQSVAAVNIASTIENVALVPFMGLGNACAITLGNYIGSGRTGDADKTARQFLRLTVAGAVLVGGLIAAISTPVLQLYRITPEAQGYVHNVLLVMAGALWIKAANMVIIVGILRSGADTRFALFIDTVPLWLIGIPMALLGGFVLHLPVHWVVLMVISDEATKFTMGVWRVLYDAG